MFACKEVKAVLLGDSGVGKSSLLLRFVTNEFTKDAQPTLGAAFQSKTIMIDERPIKFQIWDTAGQEKYRAILPLYYRGILKVQSVDAQVAILVYDVSSVQSLQVLKEWVTQLHEMGPVDQIKIIVGNKSDLEQVVSFDEVSQYANLNGMQAVLTSCKDNLGIQDVFQRLGQQVVLRDTKVESPVPLKLTNQPGKVKKQSCC